MFAMGTGGVVVACGAPSPPAPTADCDAAGVECAPFVVDAAAPDGATDGAASDATTDGAGDVLAPPVDASTDAPCLMHMLCVTLYGFCPTELVPCESSATDAGDASQEL
jgi:hypothetical protein